MSSSRLPESPLDSKPSSPRAGLVQLQGVKRNHWVPSRYNARATDEAGNLILWNTYTGAMNTFTPKDCAGIDRLLRNREGFTGELKGLAKYLYQRGYLVSQDTNEYRQVQLLAGQQHYRADILELILLASEDCNFRCVYCYEDFPRGTMEPRVREAVKNHVMKRAPGLKQLGIRWFGGEPLYGFSAIEELAPFFVEIADRYSLGFGSHMTTNGYLLTPEVAEKLLEWRITDFQITLDGTAEQHDVKRPTRDGCKTFETIHANLRDLQKRKDDFGVTIRVNFDQENQDELENLLELLRADFSGDPRFTIRFHTVQRWGGPNDANLAVCGVNEARAATSKLTQSALAKNFRIGTLQEATRPGDHVCYAARPYNFIVGADGTLMKCTIVLGSKDYNVVGNITDDGDMNIDANKFSLWTQPEFANDPTCKKCFMVPSCQGMYCPWIRIEQDTQPCPATKANVRRELLSTLQVSRIKAGVKESGESAPARSVVAAADEGKDCGASPFQRQPTITLNTVDFGHDENWIRRLSPDDLINHSGNFYPYYYLNLLSILGDKEPVEKIRGLAVESTRATLLGVREYLSSLSGLPQLAAAATEAAPATNELITLSGWDTDLIRSLLARRKGLILCSHHLGPFMKLPHELALMGFNVSLVIDDITYRESVPRLTLVKSKLQKPLADAGDLAGRPAAENIHLLNIINAQDKDGFVLLLKALERGESLFVYVDGNTGWDGVWGNSSKAAIDFLGFPIAVKNGIPRLAAASGAPILPLITLNRGSERAEVVFGDPIEAPRPMSPEQRDAFVLDSMKSIYKLLEDRALTFIEQWTSSCFLHRWRIPPDSGKQEAPTDAEVGEIESLLRTGKSLRINPTRIAGLNVENSAALVDARTLRVYRAPEGARDVFLHLLEEGGLNAVQMDLLNGRNRDILTMIAHLKKLEVIVSN